MRCIIRRACELMHDSTMAIKEVAERCGFAHQFHFSRQFKLSVGASPTEFRRRLGTASR
jgi:AraC-like DNA-binding protein